MQSGKMRTDYSRQLTLCGSWVVEAEATDDVARLNDGDTAVTNHHVSDALG